MLRKRCSKRARSASVTILMRSKTIRVSLSISTFYPFSFCLSVNRIGSKVVSLRAISFKNQADDASRMLCNKNRPDVQVKGEISDFKVKYPNLRISPCSPALLQGRPHLSLRFSRTVRIVEDFLALRFPLLTFGLQTNFEENYIFHKSSCSFNYAG